jgi:hypothetical protein
MQSAFDVCIGASCGRIAALLAMGTAQLEQVAKMGTEADVDLKSADVVDVVS